MQLLFISIILFGAIPCHAQRNNSSPFVEEGKVWRMLYHNIEAAEIYPDYEYCYYIDGDTMIAGTRCKKLYAYNEDNTKETEYKMSLFETGGKVLFFPKKSENFHVLYDFNISTENNVVISDITHPAEWNFAMEASGERVICVNGIDMRSILVNRVPESEISYPSGWWIEGVGSELGPFNTWTFGTAGNNSVFLRCEKNEQPVFDLSVFKSVVSSITRKEQFNDAGSAALYNILGYQILGNIGGSTQGYNIKNLLPRGVYIRDGRKFVVK